MVVDDMVCGCTCSCVDVVCRCEVCGCDGVSDVHVITCVYDLCGV